MKRDEEKGASEKYDADFQSTNAMLCKAGSLAGSILLEGAWYEGKMPLFISG